MKRNLSLSWIIAATTTLATCGESTAQQAPGYAYPQPPSYAQPQYQTPQYQPQQGYQAPSYQPPQQGYAQPGQTEYVSPGQFLPTFGRKFGSMFRKLFYGDAPQPGYGQQAPAYNNGAQQYRGNLDQPPLGYLQPNASQRAAPQGSYPPRYETAPQSRSTAPAMPPTSRMNSGSTQPVPSSKKKIASNPPKSKSKESASARKYTPPSVTREPSKRPQEEVTSTETPPTRDATTPYKLPGTKPSTTTANSDSSKNSGNAAASSGSFLRGKKASKEGRVISPYPPYRELDISGLSSGSLALDPTTQKVFEVP